MEVKEVSSMVVDTEEEVTGLTELIQAGNCEPKAKKRRVGESDSGNATVSSIEDSFSVENQVNVEIQGQFVETTIVETTIVEVSGDLMGNDSVNGDLNENVCVDGLNEKVLVGENLKDTVVYEVNLSGNCCFDGKLRGNGFVEEIEKKEMDFNGDVEGTLVKEVGVDEDFKKIELLSASEEETQVKGCSVFNELESGDSSLVGDVGTQGEDKKIEALGASEEETQVNGCSVFNEHEPGDSSLVRDVGTQSEDMGFVGGSKACISEVLECTPRKECSNTECYSTVGGTDDGSCLSSKDKGLQKKKKRRVTFGNTNSTEVVLRRSSRRISSLSSSNRVTRMDESSAVNISYHGMEMDESSTVTILNHVTRMDESSAVNILSHELSVVSGPEGYTEQSSLPPKVELPPSSSNVILDEIPILDVFSVYSILRSFSTILFLSPFELEAFVAALKYKFPNSLIDSIHVSILQTLKLNLEFLSNEGSQSASNCLRSLNWGLLDLITWPVYMVEYLLIHCPGLKPGFELNRLKLLNGDYYQQPPTTKVEILRCLCDDLIEAEVIRLELNRRTIASDLDVDVDRTPNIVMYKKRKDPIDESGGSCLAQEIVDKTTDWNSDECCLCKMDGNLICCDGCPAAYHSRCVGIAKDLLPEGDWYCPECMIDKNNPCMKLAMSLRGAEVLATDPYGRVYFSSCGYLLVSDSCETDSSYYYYHKDDLTIVIDVLKSSHILYNEVISAISMNWGIPVGSGPKSLLESPVLNVETDLDVEGQVLSNGLSAMPIKVLRRNGARRGTRKTSRSIRSDSATGNPFIEMAGPSPFASSKSSTEFLLVTGLQKSSENEADSSNKSSGISNEHETPENANCHASQCSKPNGSDVKQEKNIVSADPDHTLSVLNSGTDLPYWQLEPDSYVNYYSFAQFAASVAVELTCKSSDIINDDSKRSAEEIITAQMKAISKKWIRVCWSNSQRLCKDAEKESCGWCFYCKNPTDSEACMFNMTDKKPSSEGSVEAGSSSKRNKNSHLTTIINYILSIEERLSGLLSGPWHNPHYRKHWRKSVLKASNVASLKHQLLSLESNLHRLALSSEWLNLVDSVVTVGSACHILTKGQTSSSKHGGSRKRAKISHNETNCTSNASTRPGILWWRGGQVSRQLFHCKVLPHSLAFKGGRQAGRGKIATLLYPDNSEFVRRSKYIAWRAAIEMSTSIPQLACQVRELDFNLRWDDLENTQLFSQLAQESIKLMRPFKKVSIRRKCVEGTLVKYLLDFGKRKTIPEVVIQHGVMLEVSASERKKYWLDESHVPLHLLKAFEEKKVARLGNKTAPGMLREEAGKLMKKTNRKRGLSHLLSKSENYQCGQCNKDVPVSEAVSCTDCKGFFHKKHFRKTKGTVTSECTYKCHKCQNKIHVKKPLKMKKKKGRPPLPQKKKISILVPVPVPGRGRGRPKGSVKKVKHISLQSRKLAGIKEQEQVQATKGTSKKAIGSQKGKRTRVYHAFWLNGLRLTRKPNDARGVHFRETKLLLPSEDSNAVCTRPICCLCPEAGYTSRLIYVGCEICQDWFHGDAFGLTLENSANLLGFRCHKCRKRKPPLCPHLVGLAVSRSIYTPQVGEEKTNAENELVKEVPSDIDKSPTEKDEHRFSPNEVSLYKNHKPCELPDSNHENDKEDNFSFSDPTVMFMECETESEKGVQSVRQEQEQEQKADKVLDSNQIPVLGV